MPYITLTEEQARVVAGNPGSVEVRDPEGRLMAFLEPLNPDLAEIVEECRRRRADPGPRIPAENVEAMLRKFEEIEQNGGLTHKKMDEIVRRVQAGEAL
jgi:hypothetical protein